MTIKIGSFRIHSNRFSTKIEKNGKFIGLISGVEIPQKDAIKAATSIVCALKHPKTYAMKG